MSTHSDPQNEGLANTYVVQNRQDDKELIRLTTQDQILTTGMGGALSEQADPTAFHRVLDVGCGTGGWLIDAAKSYPTMSRLDGADINKRMIAYARTQAETAQVTERVEFHVMDALRMLEFPTNTFDLVNARFCESFLRTWDWPKFVSEMLRVARPGGVLRVTCFEIIPSSDSSALTQLCEMLVCAYYKAGHLFTQDSAGVTKHLAQQLFMRGYGCQEVQTKVHTLEYQMGTAIGQAHYENTRDAFQVLRPFIEKRGCGRTDYETIYQQALDDMQHPDFHLTWNLLTAWGSKLRSKAK